jgi:pimeloyl-ACP methyl ester carboxylesterase
MNNGNSKQSIEVNGLKIAYLEGGQGDPILFIHGWPTFSYLWRRQMSALSERFQVCAVDLPGFGDSDKPADVGYTLGFYTDVLTGCLDALGVERVTLVSHDLGGTIALLWAVRHPERLARLVITDTAPYPDLPLMIRLMLLAARLPGLGQAMVSRPGLRFMFQLGTAGRGVVTDELVAAYDRPLAETPGARNTLLRILTEIGPGEMGEIADNLGNIYAPVLILWAEKDPTAPLSIARRLHTDIRGSLLKTVPDCGHFLTEDRPEEVSRLLLEFLT